MLGFVGAKIAARAGLRQTSVSIAARAASTVGAVLEEAVENLPHKYAVRFIKQDYRWSFKEFNDFVDELANGFLDSGFEKGSVIAVWLPNSAENLVTQYAAAKAGLTLAVIDSEISSANEVEFILHDSKANGIIFEPKIAGRDHTKVIQELFPELATYESAQQIFRPKAFRHLHSVISTGIDFVDGVIPFRGIMLNSPEPYVMNNVKKSIDAKTPLAILYKKADGQTPKKSATLTHGDFLKNASELAKSLKLTNTDKILLTDLEGISFAPFASVEKSAMVVVPSSEYDEEAVQKAQTLEGCNIVGSGANFKRV